MTLAEILLVVTVIGLIATFAVPWVELRGAYAAWRVTEWHAVWRSNSSFQLAEIVAPNYPVPIEFATEDMRRELDYLIGLGRVLGASHGLVLTGLLIAIVRQSRKRGASYRRVAIQLSALVAANLVALALLSVLLGLPSSISTNVDFRTPEVHTDTLVWTGLTLLPIGPIISSIAVVVEAVLLLRAARTAFGPNPNRTLTER